MFMTGGMANQRLLISLSREKQLDPENTKDRL